MCAISIAWNQYGIAQKYSRREGTDGEQKSEEVFGQPRANANFSGGAVVGLRTWRVWRGFGRVVGGFLGSIFGLCTWLGGSDKNLGTL